MILDFLDFNDSEASLRINFTTVSEEFDIDGVMVTLEWMQGSTLYSYRVSVVPPSWNIISSRSERVRVQVKALYDIPYNVSVETLLCGISAGTTAATTLYTMVKLITTVA